MPRAAPDPALLAQERRDRIRAELRRSGAVRSNELSTRWAVSAPTIRRDLTALEASGYAVRVHGGAVNAPGTPVISEPVPDRPSAQRAGLRAMATAAVGIVRSGMAVGLCGGPAVEALAAELTEHQGITVVTNSLTVAALLDGPGHTSPTVILTGGQYGRNGLLVGPIALEAVASMRVDTAFVDCSGADSEAGLTVGDLAEAQLRRQLFCSATRRVLLAESAVFGTRALAPFAALSELDAVFTEPDSTPDPARDAVLCAIGQSAPQSGRFLPIGHR